MAEHAVVIAGGGPTGLMLAGELALAEVDVVIVERRASQDLPARAQAVSSLTDHRGSRSSAESLDRFLSEGQVAQVAGFAGTQFDISDFPPATPTPGSGCGRSTSSASWPAGSASSRCRCIAKGA
jgi:choline dehydrogenase-like flavoprotein